MNKFYWILLTFAIGALLPIQAGINSRLSRAAANPLYASLISFFVGIVALSVYIALSRQSFSWAGIKEAPAYVWLGGILGAVYVTIVLLSFQHLGPGLTFGLIVAGQMMLSAVLEHFNILVFQQQSINIYKIGGMLLIIAGVMLIKKS